jgi:hypothetical protein
VGICCLPSDPSLPIIKSNLIVSSPPPFRTCSLYMELARTLHDKSVSAAISNGKNTPQSHCSSAQPCAMWFTLENTATHVSIANLVGSPPTMVSKTKKHFVHASLRRNWQLAAGSRLVIQQSRKGAHLACSIIEGTEQEECPPFVHQFNLDRGNPPPSNESGYNHLKR